MVDAVSTAVVEACELVCEAAAAPAGASPAKSAADATSGSRSASCFFIAPDCTGFSWRDGVLRFATSLSMKCCNEIERHQTVGLFIGFGVASVLRWAYFRPNVPREGAVASV